MSRDFISFCFGPRHSTLPDEDEEIMPEVEDVEREGGHVPDEGDARHDDARP